MTGPQARGLLLLDVDGPDLLALAERTGLELVWATTWLHEAHSYIGARIGLPPLPVIEFDTDGPGWKFDAVCAYAAGRPVAWFDDEFDTRADERDRFLAARAGEPTLLRTVSPVTGLTADDFAAVEQWSRGIGEESAT